MKPNEVLSQDEVDALLHGVDNGDVDTEAAQHPDDGEARPYSLTNQERIVRGRMPTLEMLNERFARYFRVSMFNILRRSCEVSVNDVEIRKFADYINTLFIPANLNLIKMKPLRGRALLALDPKLVFLVVDNYFGGDGRFYSKVEGREFSELEMRVVRTILKHAFQDLKEAWKPVADIEFEYLNSEVNPQFANIVSPTEVVVVTSFHIEFDNGGGDLHLTVPYGMLEPLRELLAAGVASDRVEFDKRWTDAFRQEMKHAAVDLRCSLGGTEVTLREVMRLRAGDIIPIDIPAIVTATVEGVPVLHCQYGISRGSNALKIVAPITESSDTG